MAQYNTLNIKSPNSQLDKLKSGIKNGIELILKISLNVVGDSNDENNFVHKLLLINTQVSKLRKAFANNSLANIKLSKTQLHKIGQSGGFLGRLLGPLLQTGLPLMKNVLKPLAIHKKMFEYGIITLIISNKEMNYIMKIVKSVEESGLLIKGVSETITNEAKEQKGRFLSMLLGALGASLLGNLLTGKGTISAGEGAIRASQNFQCCLIL